MSTLTFGSLKRVGFILFAGRNREYRHFSSKNRTEHDDKTHKTEQEMKLHKIDWEMQQAKAKAFLQQF